VISGGLSSQTDDHLDRGSRLGHTAAVAGRLAFVGRNRELAELSSALDGTAAGRGGIWLLSGIAGIGKSRLAEEVTREAADRQLTVAWGRCWEAGGAPAFWPWLQALRSLHRERREQLSPAVREHLSELFVELGASGHGAAADADRFRLLDELTRVLCEIGSSGPVLVVLDDLHAADHSTLMLLHFAARQLFSAPVMVLGTLRDRDVPEATQSLIARLSQDAHTMALGPLDRDAVETYVSETTSGIPDHEALAATLHERTDGHPLFLTELVRWISSTPAASAGAVGELNWPPGLEHALREHVSTIPDEHRETLEMAAVMGRELSAIDLARLFARELDEVRRALDEAVRLGLVLAISAESYRFAHILVRDVLERELEAARRYQLHRRLADAMREQGDRSWSEIAHHYQAAGPDCLESMVGAVVRAAEEAIAGFAFEDAADMCERAMAVVEDSSPGLRGELLVVHGRACILAGQRERGRTSCEEAVSMARASGDPELLARAALERGAMLVFAQVDVELVALLREALGGLPPGDSALRALVQARLAAAMQPAEEPDEPIALALEAIEIARRVGDDATLLMALRNGCSAMVDLAPPETRMPLNEEHAQLAADAGANRDALRAQTRLIFDYFELGDRRGADARVRAATALVEAIDHPSVAWRVPAMEAMRSLWDGALEAALQVCERAAESGIASGNENARTTTILQRQRILRMLGRHAELAAGIAGMRTIYSEAPALEPCRRVMVATQLLEVGEREAALDTIDEAMMLRVLRVGDRTALEALAELAFATGNREVAAGVAERLDERADGFIAGGVIGMTWDGPVRRALALCAWTNGDLPGAAEHFEVGIALARRMGGEPVAIWMLAELGELLLEMGEAERGRSVLEQARRGAESLSMASVLARARAALDGTSEGRTPATPTTAPVLERDGDVWKVSFGESTFRVKNSKGMQFLAALIARPRQELHVLELAAPPTDANLDGADAEVLDETARASYKERIQALREELAEAEEWNDPARAEAARSELDFLTTELARGMGLGGRPRQFRGNAERARVNVQRRIRAALQRLSDHDEALARHLERSVKTGMRCSYDPE
jgi:hypothetical protein